MILFNTLGNNKRNLLYFLRVKTFRLILAVKVQGPKSDLEKYSLKVGTHKKLKNIELQFNLET